jgi:fumagillin biosynthesis cytochrome P450 monooxygenase
MMVHFSAAFVPLASPVDIIPAFKYLPEWFPGTSFKGKAKEVRQITQAAADTPYTFVQQQMTTQAHSPSYVSKLVEQLTGNGQRSNFDTEDAIKWSAVNLFAGGADTTVSSLFSVVLAMLKFPEVQRKAQNEIDTLTGRGRLPCFEDRDNLPYMNRVVKEALRWFPIVPLGLAHTVDEDVFLRNYSIPKGAVLLPAVRWFLHDPQVYADPEVFDPDRYLPPRNEPDPATVIFGFGRRVCPGRYLADSSLFLTIAQMLATFDISKALDDEGKEIEPHVTSEPGLIDHPATFPYRIVPRSQKHVSFIRSIEVDHPWEQSSANALPYLSLGGQKK